MAPETAAQAASSRKQSANSSPHSGSAQESVSPSILSKASPRREGKGRGGKRKEADVYKERGKRRVAVRIKRKKGEREGVKNLNWMRGKKGERECEKFEVGGREMNEVFSCAVHLKNPYGIIDYPVRSA
jgi:hypothetical protein